MVTETGSEKSNPMPSFEIRYSGGVHRPGVSKTWLGIMPLLHRCWMYDLALAESDNSMAESIIGSHILDIL